MSLLKTITLFLTAMGLSTFAFAKNDSPKNKPSAPSAATFVLDVKSSSIEWLGSKKMGSAHNGNISFSNGQVEVAGTEIKSGSFTVNMSTITNMDLKDNPEYQGKLVKHLSSPDFFNVAKYPESTFKITKVESKGPQQILVKGDLTMVGLTQPIEFPARIQFEKNTLSAEAKLKLDRTLWGLKYNSGNFFKDLAAEKIINNDFELTLKLVSTKM